MLGLAIPSNTALPGVFDQVDNIENIIAYAALGTIILLLGMFIMNTFLSIKTVATKKPPNRILLFLSGGIFMFLFVTNVLASVFLFVTTQTFNSNGIIIFSIWFVLAVVVICLTTAALRTETIPDDSNSNDNTEVVT